MYVNSPNVNDSTVTKISSSAHFPNTNENFKVVVRIRPPLPREIDEDKFISTVINEN